MAAEPQNPNQAIDMMGPITVTHVLLMAVLAGVAILIIWWGTVLRRRRKQAQKQVAENFQVAEEHGATSEPTAQMGDDGTARLSADVPEQRAPAPAPAPVPVPVPVPAPAPLAAAPPVARETAIAGDLTQIKGLGPKLAAMLAARGIDQVDQLAALTPEQAAALDADLGTFQGRLSRDRWVEQARLLSTGDRAGYEAAFGKLGG